MSGLVSRAAPLKLEEFSRLTQPVGLAEASGFGTQDGGPAAGLAGLLGRNGYGQALAPLGAAALEDVSSARRGHARHESVRP